MRGERYDGKGEGTRVIVEAVDRLILLVVYISSMYHRTPNSVKLWEPCQTSAPKKNTDEIDHHVVLLFPRQFRGHRYQMPPYTIVKSRGGITSDSRFDVFRHERLLEALCSIYYHQYADRLDTAMPM